MNTMNAMTTDLEAIRERANAATREDFIRILDAAHEETDAATDAIIKAVERECKPYLNKRV